MTTPLPLTWIYKYYIKQIIASIQGEICHRPTFCPTPLGPEHASPQGLKTTECMRRSGGGKSVYLNWSKRSRKPGLWIHTTTQHGIKFATRPRITRRLWDLLDSFDVVTTTFCWFIQHMGISNMFEH